IPHGPECQIPAPDALREALRGFFKYEARAGHEAAVWGDREVPERLSGRLHCGEQIEGADLASRRGVPDTHEAVTLGRDRGSAVRSETEPGTLLRMTPLRGAETHFRARWQRVAGAIEPQYWGLSKGRAGYRRASAAEFLWRRRLSGQKDRSGKS